MSETKLPRATAKRIPQYYRQFQKLQAEGVTNIMSKDLALIMKIESTTIRRDFSYIGELGKQRVGYDVNYVVAKLQTFLGFDEPKAVILIGAGHLATALINYNYIKGNNILISAAFDNSTEKVGSEIRDIPVYHMSELATYLTANPQITVAILSAPSEVAQEITNQLIAQGINGILNFSSKRLDVPKHVVVENVDLASKLQTLVYLTDQT
ncbi:MAG: redox-sensing transcriptional repressor Rex [Culicoidibacterales bacterium]